MLNILTIRTIVDVINAGLTTVDAVVGAVQAGRARIREAGSDVDITAEQLAERLAVAIAEVKALAAQTGDEAEARINARANGVGQ